MNYLIMISHGAGLELVQTSLVREFAEAHPNDQVYVSAINRYFADMLANENERVHSIDRATIASLFTTIMNDRDSWYVYQIEPYQQYKFFSRQDNIVDAIREQLGLKRKRDWDKNGSSYEPYLELPSNMKQEALNFVKAHPKFVIFQRQGGINPVSPPQERQRMASQPEQGLIRAYPIKESEKVVELLHSKGYEVLQYCLPEEPHIKGCLYMQQEVNQLMYMELAKYAEGVITIDSSLLHLTIHNAKKVVCIWEQSASGDHDCRGFGYKKAVNLFAKCDTLAPYFNGIPASPYIEHVKPEEVVEAFERSTEDKDKVPQKQ